MKNKNYISFYFSLLLFIFSCVSINANPFIIHFPNKKNLTNEDYLEIQRQLRSIEIDQLLNELYEPNESYTDIHDFSRRCSRGIKAILIDEETRRFPIQKLEKIGKGGDRCIVSYATYNNSYSTFLESSLKALKASGFNGYFYYRIGGFPNPSGEEIQYAGVPYSFKILMLIEAYQLGFNKVLWIDSAFYPLKDPSPLFDKFGDAGALFYSQIWPSYGYILPETRNVIEDLTGVNVLTKGHITGGVFGLNMNTEEAQRFINDYITLIKLGTPFLSCFPEEYVTTALFWKYQFWEPSFADQDKLIQITNYDCRNIWKKIEEARRDDYYFYYQKW